MKPDPSIDPIAEAEEAGGFAVQQLLHLKTRPAGGLEQPPAGADLPASKRDRFDKKFGTLLWKPPNQARYDFAHKAHMIVLATPSQPGKTRLFFAVYRGADETPALMKFVLNLLSSPPLRFLSHIGNNDVLDGDNVFIAAQGARLRDLESRGKSFQDVYFMPTSMDAAVARVRGWFARHGFGKEARNGGIAWAPGSVSVPPPTRFEALERWESHTRQCPDCLRTFKVLSALRNAAAALCGVALTWAIGTAAAMVSSGGASFSSTFTASIKSRLHLAGAAGAAFDVVGAPAVARSLAVAGAAAVAFVLLRKSAQKFVFIDYVHADHD